MCPFVDFPWPMLVLNMVLLICMFELMFGKAYHILIHIMHTQMLIKKKDICAFSKGLVFQI
jgi:hypothetical protein